MSKIQSFVTKQNLASFSTLITDIEAFSAYFQLAQLSDVLTIGKNAFLINGSPFLKETSDVLVEILDANGDPLFLHAIPNYAEGLARVVSIEVYSTTPRGLATLTILGEAKIDVNGNDVPQDWVGKYNVKFTKTINVEPTLLNSTPVRLYNTPSLSVSEILMPYREVSTPISIIITGSAILQGIPNKSLFSVNDAIEDVQYSSVVSSGSLKFNRNMIGGSYTASYTASNQIAQHTSSISDVQNDTTLILTSPLQNGINYLSYTTPSFSITYVTSSTYVQTVLSRSFANINLNSLETFSGDIARAKFYVKSVDGLGNYEPIGDILLEENELTMTQSLGTGQANIPIGYFNDQTFADLYWMSDLVTSSSYSN